MNALVLDDEQRYREHLKRSLEREELKIHVANGADEAKQIVRENDVDLMIVDVKLANSIDGLEFADWAMKQRSNVTLIVITGYNCPEYEQRSRTLGAVAYLEKPFSLDELEVHVQRAIDHRRMLLEMHRLEQELAAARDSDHAQQLLSLVPIVHLTRDGVVAYASPEGRAYLEAVTDQQIAKPVARIDEVLLARLFSAVNDGENKGQIPVFHRDDSLIHYDAIVHKVELGGDSGLIVYFAKAELNRDQIIDNLWTGILTRAAKAV